MSLLVAWSLIACWSAQQHTPQEHGSQGHSSQGSAAQEHGAQEPGAQEHGHGEHAAPEHGDQEHDHGEHAAPEHAAQEHGPGEHGVQAHGGQAHGPGEHDPRNHNSKYLGDIDVGAWEARFESAGREVFDRREDIVRALPIEPGHAVADIGAGTGVLLPSLVGAVGPQGTVFATELSPAFRAHLSERARQAGWSNVEVIESSAATTGLADGSVDVAVLVDVYHHLEDKPAFLADLARALRPGATLAIIDLDPGRDGASSWVREHVAQTGGEVRDEVVGTGLFQAIEAPDVGLVENHVQLFVLGAAR